MHSSKKRLAFTGLLLCLAPCLSFGQTLLGSVTLGPPPNLTGPTRMVINPISNKTYVFGGNAIDVVDLNLNRVTSTIIMPTPPPSASPLGPDGAWIDTVKNRIYTFRGNQFVVIDGQSDAVVQTFSLPPLINDSYGPISYNAGTHKFYVGETSPTASLNNPSQGEVRVLDDTSFATSAIITLPNTNGGVPLSERPYQILVNPATNRVYILYQVSGVQILDGTTDSLIASAACSTTCNALVFPPGTNAMIVNPADNSVWVAYSGSIPGAPGGEDGANGFPGPPFTIFWRIDGTDNSVAKQFQIFGQETELLGFDPVSGLLYLMATNLPTVANPTTGSPVISAPETMLVVLDPKNTAATDADPSPMRRITVDSTLLANSGSTFACGSGVQGFEPVGLDISGGYIFWRCDSTPTSFSSIVVSRTSFTDRGNVDYSQFIGQLQTPGTGQISGHAIPVAVSKDYNFGDNVGPNHVSMFFSGSDNLFYEVNAAVPSLTTVPLGAEPAGIALDPATHRAFVTDLTSKVLSIVDLNAYSLLTKAPAPGGSLIAGNDQGQYVLAGPTNAAADPAQVTGAFLFDETSDSIKMPLQASATSAVAVNPANDVGYFADGNQWFAVDLNTGSRLYAVSDLTSLGTDTCQMTGISANKLNGQVFVAGKCAAAGNTLAVFDGTTGDRVASTNVDAIMQTIGRLIVNPNTARVYVEATNPAPLSIMQSSVEVFDGTTLAHINSIADRKGPFAVNTVTNMVYAATSVAGAAAIDGLAPEQQSFFSGTLLVSGLAVDESTNNVLIASYNNYLGECCTPAVPVYQVAAGTLTVFRQDPATYLVQGLVTTAGVPQTGITITVSGPNGSFSQVTGANGIFAGRLVPGTYTVTASSPAFAFSPPSQTVTLGQIDQTLPTFLATPIFHITGSVLTQAGAAASGVTISATGTSGAASAVTNASGQYSLAGLPAGTYTVAPVSPANFYSPGSESVQINKTDAVAPQFTINPSLQITNFALSSNLLGAGVQGSGTVTINEVAAKGGIAITLTSSDAKTVKPPINFNIPAGSSTGTFTFTGSGIGTVTLTATYSGSLAVQPSSASAQISIVGTDTVHVTSATWSSSTQILNIAATSTNPNAMLTVTLASNGQVLGVMTTASNGTFALTTNVPSKPSSINVKSSLGGSTGQGVSAVP